MLRVVEEEECYAQVEKLLGGSNCHVVEWTAERYSVAFAASFAVAVADNRLEIGTWVMVGVRDYESARIRKIT